MSPNQWDKVVGAVTFVCWCWLIYLLAKGGV